MDESWVAGAWADWPAAFALTCLVEVPAYLLAFAAMGWLRPAGEAGRTGIVLRGLAVAFGVNLVTHPMLWLGALQLDSMIGLLFAEVLVVMAETLIIFAVLRRSLPWIALIALATNTLSFLVGLGLS